MGSELQKPSLAEERRLVGAVERFPGDSGLGLGVGMAKSQFWNVCRNIESLFQGRRDVEDD